MIASVSKVYSNLCHHYLPLEVDFLVHLITGWKAEDGINGTTLREKIHLPN